MEKFSDKSLTIASIIFASLAIILFAISLFAANPYNLYIVIWGWVSLSVSLNLDQILKQRRIEALREILQKLLEEDSNKENG